MLETIGLYALGAAGVLSAILFYIRARIRTRDAVPRWASRRGFKLLSQRQPFYHRVEPLSNHSVESATGLPRGSGKYSRSTPGRLGATGIGVAGADIPSSRGTVDADSVKRVSAPDPRRRTPDHQRIDHRGTAAAPRCDGNLSAEAVPSVHGAVMGPELIATTTGTGSG